MRVNFSLGRGTGGRYVYTCEIFVFALERLDDVVAVVDLRSLTVDLGGVITAVSMSVLQLRLQKC